VQERDGMELDRSVSREAVESAPVKLALTINDKSALSENEFEIQRRLFFGTGSDARTSCPTVPVDLPSIFAVMRRQL
jgi:hypothetical protein